jgi:zinc protease
MKTLRSLMISSSLLLAACGGAGKGVVPTAQPEPPPVLIDLGPKPEAGPAKPFAPPNIETFELKNGMKVWLASRRGLPLVSLSLVVLGGSSIDPADKPGLMYITTDMLDEGAGTRSALEISGAVADLGASMSLQTGLDATTASLTVLKKNIGPAMAIFSDVIMRPQFEAKEFKRVSDLWRTDLKTRADDPDRVARVVNAAVLYGHGTPYGHPSEGSLEGAEKIDLQTVQKFYLEQFRPEQSVLVVAGDITKDELMTAIGGNLGTWKASTPPPKKPAKPVVQQPKAATERPKIVLVDRPEAPQSVITIVREGVMASEPDAIRIDLVNTPLGGSFTSRLNQNLREEKHWAYAARTLFFGTRGKGAFWAYASVETPATGPALKEALRELEKMAAEGPTAEELDKAKAQDRADLLRTFETIIETADRLAGLARVGLPPTYDVDASLSRQTQTLADVAALAKAHVDPASATIVVVGPKAAVWKDLTGLGRGEPVMLDAEGKPAANVADVKKDAPADKPKETPKETPKGK